MLAALRPIPSKFVTRSKDVTDVNAQQKLPFNLIPTNLEGVHSFVPPPKGTDLTKADQETLLKHGLWMRRPDLDREPKLFAMWCRYVNEIWTEENFVPPVFEVTKDTPHDLKGTLVPTPNGYISSGGWSGVVTVGRWVGVMGMWQVPRIRRARHPGGPDGSLAIFILGRSGRRRGPDPRHQDHRRVADRDIAEYRQSQ